MNLQFAEEPSTDTSELLNQLNTAAVTEPSIPKVL
jgi:hypothetical protein